MTQNAPELDVLIIGGGQAGLAMGFHLKDTPFPPLGDLAPLTIASA